MTGSENSLRKSPSRLQIITGAIVLLALGALVGAGALLIYNSLQKDQPTEAGDSAPDIALKDMQGGTVHLSDYRGKTVLLNFRTTWCGYCRSEAPELEAAHQSIPDLVVLGVYVNESPSDVREYVQELGLTFTALLDDTGDAARAYGIRGIPKTFFLDEKGRVFAEHMGPLTAAGVQEYLDGRSR